MYRELNVDRIVTTCERLHRRICERFPESGLSKVAEELLVVTRESQERIDRGRRPLWELRVLAVLAIIAIGGSPPSW